MEGGAQSLLQSTWCTPERQALPAPARPGSCKPAGQHAPTGRLHPKAGQHTLTGNLCPNSGQCTPTGKLASQPLQGHLRLKPLQVDTKNRRALEELPGPGVVYRALDWVTPQHFKSDEEGEAAMNGGWG